MLFDEIHNKRVLQIMPLNTSLSLCLVGKKSFVIIIIEERTTPWSIRFRAWRIHSHWNYLGEMLMKKYLINSHFFFLPLITNLLGRTLSSGLSTWLSKYYPSSTLGGGGCALSLFFMREEEANHLHSENLSIHTRTFFIDDQSADFITKRTTNE